MKDGNSLQREISHQASTASVAETGINQAPYLLAALHSGSCFCDLLKLTSISSLKNPQEDEKPCGTKKPKTNVFGAICKTYACFPSFIRTVTVDSGISPDHALLCSWVLPPIGNWNFHSAPCPEGVFNLRLKYSQPNKDCQSFSQSL